MNILLVEDDVELALSLSQRLRVEGHVVLHQADGAAGLEAARQGRYDVVILDRMLPGLDGLAVVRALRQSAIDTPVLFLTTKSGIDDRVEGLEAGADDYLVKPFAFEELAARIRVLARRSSTVLTRLTVGGLEMDLVRRSVLREGRAIDLLPQEFRLLEYLMRHANTTVTRKMLLENVWDIHFDPHTSVVESHVSRLRAKLNDGFTNDVVQTVRGAGYRLVAAG